MAKNDALRRFGISHVGEIPWGTHLCQFYENKEDLIDILVPYFAEGLRNNEFCMWITSRPLEVKEAKEALSRVLPNIDEYFRKGQIEIISYNNWYLLGGKFDCNRVLQGWVQKEKYAIQHGFDGLRLSGNTFWIERNLWTSFVDYEEAVNSIIVEHRMIALCTYCLLSCSGTDVVDVIRNHVGTLIKQGKKWSLVENAVRRKLANGALELSEHKYSVLFEKMQDAYAYHKVLLDEKGKPVDYVFLEVNETFEKFTGLKKEKIIGKKVTIVFPGIEKDPADLIGTYGKVAITGQAVKFETYFEPLKKWYSISAYSPKKEYFVAIFEDITGRKKSDAEISRLASFPALNPNPIIEVDFDGTVQYANQATENLFPDLKSKGLGHRLLGDWEQVVKVFRDEKKRTFNRDEKIGSHWYNQRFYLTQDQRIRIYSVNVDERKQAEEALRTSEQRWATTLSSVGDAVIATDAKGKVDFMNGVAEKLTGWTLAEALKKSVQEVFNVINEQTRLKVENPIDRVLKEGVIVGLANHSVLIRKDSIEVPIDDSGAPIKDKDGKITGVVLIFRDISERKEAEEKLEEYRKDLEKLVEERTKQLKDSERLLAIGQTAGMVGHDIRNPLQAITGDLYLAKTELASIPESDEKKNALESLQEIEKNVDYINKIVADLQDFARPLAPKLEETDLKQVVHSVLAQLEIPGNVTVKYSIRKDFPKLRTDEAYMRRILTNLVNNAVQAMPNGGKLAINAVTKNGKAIITVEDKGEGIPESVRNNLFTPLVTTKSKGQGFGLAVVKRFTEGMGGTVTFESEIGKGTKFIIELPI